MSCAFPVLFSGAGSFARPPFREARFHEVLRSRFRRLPLLPDVQRSHLFHSLIELRILAVPKYCAGTGVNFCRIELQVQ